MLKCSVCFHVHTHVERKAPWFAVFCCPVFKILKLGADQFDVQNDFRDLPHKQLNLNYSSNDVQWNPKDGRWAGLEWNYPCPSLCLSVPVDETIVYLTL